MSDNSIKYSDLVQPDGSIKNLIDQLEQLNQTYSEMFSVIQKGAKNLISSLNAVNTSTAANRAQVDEAVNSAGRLARAQKELKFAMSDVGKEVAWLKAQTTDQNRMSVEMKRQQESLIGSYNKLKLEMKEYVALWKSMGASERSGAFGKDVLRDILNLKGRLSDLDNQLKVHVQNLTEVQKAEQKLQFLRSEEGQKLIELKRQIREASQANNLSAQSLSDVERAAMRYNNAIQETNVQLKEYQLKTKEANRIATLQAQINNSAEGSYNRIAAQYELNKINLNKLSQAERENSEAGKRLQKEVSDLYFQMVKLQEASGTFYTKSKDFTKAWNGLGYATVQIVRELPTAAMGLNMLVLAVSNNVPILLDEIKKVRLENERLKAEGKATVSVGKQIASAIFNWQTALILLMTVFATNGKNIVAWIGKVVRGRDATESATEAVRNLNKELEKTNGSYGKNVVNLKELNTQWGELTNNKDRMQWIKDHKSEFDQLGISIKNINEAENLFEEHTNDMILALQARAKAFAAQKLAQDKYEKALVKEAEAEALRLEGPKSTSNIAASFATPGGPVGANSNDVERVAQQRRNLWLRDINNLKKEGEALTKEAEQYFQLEEKYNKEFRETLKKAGIDLKHRDGGGAGSKPKDLSDIIVRNGLTLQKKYELSLSNLQRDEFEKRRIEAKDQAEQAIRELEAKFKKNEEYLANKDGKYKPLTEEQIAEIDKQQKEITAIIENTRRKLANDLANIDYEAEIDSVQSLRQIMNGRIGVIEKSIEDEKKLKLKQLDDQKERYKTKGVTINGEVSVTEDMSPEELAKYEREKEMTIAYYDSIIYNLRAKNIEAQVELVKKGSMEEIEILKERNENELKLALAQNVLKKKEEQEDPNTITARYTKKGKIEVGGKIMDNFDELQERLKAEFEIRKHNSNQISLFTLNQERDRWDRMILLAKEGMVEWSDEQLKAAHAYVDKLNREIKDAESFMWLAGQEGFGNAILMKLGFSDEAIEGLNEGLSIAYDNILSNLKDIFEAEVELAEQAAETSQKRVEAAERVYEAELEASRNGYANNVITAKKELQLEKQKQSQKQKLLEQAQRRQAALDAVTQASSLITATANLWSSLSKVPYIGYALAIAATASMWASFAVAKIKAKQVTASQQYGEGGLEFLEGGSHASGNDIDLQTRNSKGKNMRAEGGEAMAIINKRSTRKYKKVLPELVDSLNKGMFEEKFSRAFKTGDELSQNIVYQQQTADLTRLEEDVRALKRNSEHYYYVTPDGTLIERRGNVLRKTH